MQFYSEKLEAVLSELKTDKAQGLSQSEAEKRLSQYGENKLREKKKKSMFMRFVDQLKDVMILILLAAALISFVIAVVEKDPGELFEPILILLIVVLNAIMGVFQESKAEKALDALKSMSAPHARVIRDGEEKIIESSQLVVGDIVHLEAGDFIPADVRLIASSSLKSEESALTGESVPSEKDAAESVAENAPLGDRSNMLFSGCSVTYGTATAVVCATGMNTEIGKISNMLDNEESTQTHLQKKLAQLGKYLGVIAILCCVIIFIIGVTNNVPVLDIFMTSVSLAVSAIPEGLPAIVTIVLSIGVQRMVKKNAIIRRLPAVETLGSASVICSDKTGTLTQNRMTLVSIYVDGDEERCPIENATDENRLEMLRLATLCCDGAINVTDEGVQHIGDPTETAIVYAAYEKGMTKASLESEYPRILEFPFDSDRKLMTSINEVGGKKIAIVKGAFDMMTKLCVKGDIEKARMINDEMSENALRVLAVATKELDSIPENAVAADIECDLCFLGLVGMIDPARPEAKAAVAVCRKAGIRPVMITGDHVITARAIAKELGIYNEGDRAITGVELDNMTDAELDENVEKISVYARVSPENKIRIVKAWQRKDMVVSMTGDGVNDAPALKAADIGCAMGITGTDVAKGAADITLTDDNFATIVDAVREGRGIYANIKKVVGFLLGTNIGEVIAVFSSMLIWKVSPLLSMQLLWINLVTDSLPAIALGMEAVEDDIMEKDPKPKKEGIFAGGMGIRVVLQGFMFAILTLIGFRIGWNVTGTLEGGQTLAFMVLAISQVIQALNMRSDRSLFKIGFFTNKTLSLALLASIVLVALVLFTPLRIPFGMAMLPGKLYLSGLGLALVPMVIMELSKAVGIISHKK